MEDSGLQGEVGPHAGDSAQASCVEVWAHAGGELGLWGGGLFGGMVILRSHEMCELEQQIGSRVYDLRAQGLGSGPSG